VSLAVTTYHAGKLALIRRNREGVIDTHFSTWPNAMGLTIGENLLALAAADSIIEFALDGSGKYREVRRHETGNQRAHEMGYCGDQLVYVNTLRSCICTAEGKFFWSPKFMAGKTDPGDHCHLNGLCMVDGSPRWATAHASTLVESGWRDHKNSGVLIDIPTGEVVVDGLSLPHSPRWHNGVLWLCESGTGSLGIVDLQHGTYEPVVHLEGFTRGLAFAGGKAFVGLSLARESQLDCVLAKRDDLQCGVYVVDVVTGREVSGIRLQGEFKEVFGVEIIPHPWPEVA